MDKKLNLTIDIDEENFSLEVKASTNTLLSLLRIGEEITAKMAKRMESE